MMSFIHNFLTELNRIFRDKGVLLIMVGAVVFYSFVYPLPYSRGVLTEVNAVAVDLDDSALSRSLIRMADATRQVRISRRAADRAEAEMLVAQDQASGIILIPKDFERDIKRGRKAHVGLYVDAAYFLTYRQVMTGLVSAVRTMSAGIEIQRLTAKGMPRDSAAGSAAPIRFVGRPLFNPTMGYAVYIVPAVLVLVLQQTLLIGLGLIGGTENERPAETARLEFRGGPTLVILSRATAVLAVYLVHVIFIFGFIFKIWNLPLEAGLPEITLFLTPFLLASVMLGQALAGLFSRRESAIQVMVFTSLLAVLLSGFSWPPDLMPAWIRALAQFFPSTPGIDGLLRLGRMGAGFDLLSEDWDHLWILTGVYFILARVLYRPPLKQ